MRGLQYPVFPVGAVAHFHSLATHSHSCASSGAVGVVELQHRDCGHLGIFAGAHDLYIPRNVYLTPPPPGHLLSSILRRAGVGGSSASSPSYTISVLCTL